jgi:hypothetical protein
VGVRCLGSFIGSTEFLALESGGESGSVPFLGKVLNVYETFEDAYVSWSERNTGRTDKCTCNGTD